MDNIDESMIQKVDYFVSSPDLRPDTLQRLLPRMPNRSFCGCATEAMAPQKPLVPAAPACRSPQWAYRRQPTLGQ